MRDGKWFKKAQGLLQLGEIALKLSRTMTAGQTIAGKTVLDLGCGEGGHAIMFAQAGARHVVGIDGRRLAVDRARFAANVLELSNIEFMHEDVRAPGALNGRFDIVLCSGILHHIEPEAWFLFLKNVARATADTAIFYTHVADEQLQSEHKLKPVQLVEKSSPPRSSWLARLFGRLLLRKPQAAAFDGYLYREHREEESSDERSSKMRASLDNDHSFWATEEVLIDALKKCGFELILKVQSPHMFRAQRFRNTRQIIVARKAC
ncbi:class I SAM-dependent methyltransferase [Sphingomonas piscis]|uniref:Class I SAM-dependent methyltransferase n=1 Tax=Sphingomonas piscis TaxID=2714943 RepID=A0A6G7YQC8_9SPHN|nr:class I SAM-dependent methyltransferase [Sphingomonas piscis]QIK78943.1 class I SAM-dependent methyltransferase [Sphingomonas piscis]